MKLVGLCSTYREGSLVQGAIRSALAACDTVVCFDGPAGQPSDRGEPSDFTPWLTRKGQNREPRLILRQGTWASDADKRTALIRYAHRWNEHAPVWGLQLDGDEILLWGEYLRDYLIRLGQRPDADRVFNMGLKLADMDGQVWTCFAKLLRLDFVDAVLESSYQIKFVGSETVMALPNEPIFVAPMQGEPHLLHRSMLRPPGRDSDRLHKRETGFYERAGEELGLPEDVTRDLFQVDA